MKNRFIKYKNFPEFKYFIISATFFSSKIWWYTYRTLPMHNALSTLKVCMIHECCAFIYVSQKKRRKVLSCVYDSRMQCIYICKPKKERKILWLSYEIFNGTNNHLMKQNQVPLSIIARFYIFSIFYQENQIQHLLHLGQSFHQIPLSLRLN